MALAALQDEMENIFVPSSTSQVVQVDVNHIIPLKVDQHFQTYILVQEDILEKMDSLE